MAGLRARGFSLPRISILTFHNPPFSFRVLRNKLKTLHKYLARQVLASLLLTVAVFTFVLLLGNALREILPLLINGQARFVTVMEIIGCLIPFVLVFALPMGFLTATLLVFGRFSADQELTAARAGGVSLLSLISPILLLSLFCCGLSAWVNLDLGPRSRVVCKNLIFQLSANPEFITGQLPEGRFVSDFPGYIFYAEKNRGGNLENVMVMCLAQNTTVQAPRGQVELNTTATNRQLVVTLFDARMVTIMTNGDAVLSSFGKLPIACGFEHGDQSRLQTRGQRHDVRAVAG